MPTILLAVKHAQLDQHNLELRQEIELESAATTSKGSIGSKPAGHEQALRGWPVVGAEGVPGVQRGSRPGTQSRFAIANETRITVDTIRPTRHNPIRT